MSDTFRQSRQGFGKVLVAILVTVAVIGVGAAVFWGYNRSSGSSLGAEASQQAKQDANARDQRVKDLQVSHQQMANQLDEIKRQLATEQGERKMLSDQVGALSGRVDSLATSATSVSAGIPLAKKKR